MPSANRVAKEKRVDELKNSFSKVQAAVLAHYSGINVEKLTQLRADLRKGEALFRVEKNTLLLRAVVGTPLEELKGEFTGPTALAITETDPVTLAKTLVAFSKAQKALQIRVGVLEGKRIEKKDIEALATIPSREVLLSRLAGSLQAPYAGLVYTLSGVLRKFLYALEAIRRKKEEQGS